MNPENFPPQNPKFSILFPLGQKILSDQVKKYTGQPLIYCAQVGSGPITTADNYYPLILFCNPMWKIYAMVSDRTHKLRP